MNGEMCGLKSRDSVLITDVPLSGMKEILEKVCHCVSVSGEAREVHGVLFRAGCFVGENVAFVHLIVDFRSFPSFRMAEAV